MKQECMVGARIPKTLVKALERIERAEETDRSTTVRKLLTRAIQDWNLSTTRPRTGMRKCGRL